MQPAQTANPSTLNTFRRIAFMEGISLLVLLLIAMPLKYFAGRPEAVLTVGWAHGILFVLYCVFLAMVWVKYKWTFGKVVLAFVASLVPFGTFWLERRLRNLTAKAERRGGTL
jgi:integral membrane protein